MNRRQFVQNALTMGILSNCVPVSGAVNPFHCTPAPTFPVPLTVGVWRSAEFPVGKHDYNVSLSVDRRLPLDKLDCDLGPATPWHKCEKPPLLDIEWKIWDGKKPVQRRQVNPIKADAWSEAETSCILGGFEGVKNGKFTFELVVKKDAGRLKALHPRINIVKNPGYWCWL